ncbi:DUF4157 domain-containing protein [Palleronia caenipelagi]|uniref:DUF4157 domain-containing protein n=1 Tax=Palleronia caenipelagi TaxID=2489174 RepID=A0A547PPM1_9RHOB|nr:DUF4157 domain-containing protein [Palleronia caenipelagi]TRD16102.1 DUF4157 domain-containing protein [Palleronia caenipelagi]
MARVTRRRRRRSRRRDQAEGARPPLPGVINARARVEDTLKSARAAPVKLPPEAKSQETEADTIAVKAVTGAPDTPSVSAAKAPTATAHPKDASGGASGRSVAPVAAPAAARTMGPGTALPFAQKSRFAGVLGASLDTVKIDTSSRAQALSDRLGARAVTVGQKIGFAAGEYRPDTAPGARLLAHELVHTVQQQRAGHRRVQCKPKEPATPKPRIAKHGHPSVEGGLLRDGSRRRMNVIVREGDTMISIATRLVKYWNDAAQDLTRKQRDDINPEIRTPTGLAKALLFHHKSYLAPPAMPIWRAGLRLPLPMILPHSGGPPIVNAPMAGLWAEGFQPEWIDALSKQAVKSQPQTALTAEERAQVEKSPNSLGLKLVVKAMTNASEALPLIRSHLNSADAAAGTLSMDMLGWMTNVQVSVLSGQPEGQDILALLRTALEKNQIALEKADKDGFTRAMNMLKRFPAAFPQETVDQLALAYINQSGKHCMTACYMGLGELYGLQTKDKVISEVKRKDKAAPGKDLKHVMTIMETMQELGRAGSPMVFNQKVGGTTFDTDPDKSMADLVVRYKTQPGVYFFGMSVVTGYHTVMLALNMNDPADPRLIWLDQHPERMSKNVLGKLKQALREYAAGARARSPKYSPLETKIWPLYPPSNLIVPVK